MNRILPSLLALIVAFSLIACGGKSKGGDNSAEAEAVYSHAKDTSADQTKSQIDSVYSDAKDTSVDKAQNQIDLLYSQSGNDNAPLAEPFLSDKQSWPTSTIYNIPEWKGITKYYGGGVSLDNYADKGAYSMNVIAPEDSLNKYLSTLKNAGFKVADNKTSQFVRVCTAEKGLVQFSITNRNFGQEAGYQINFDLTNIGKWPTYSLPGFIAPIDGKYLVNNPVIYRPGDDLRNATGIWVDDSGYNYQFTYTGLTKFQAVLYMNQVAAKLTHGSYFNESVLDYGGFGFIKGTYTWNSKNYFVYGEVVEDDTSTYTFYFGWSTKDQGW